MNTHAKIGKNEVAEVIAKYYGGQQIFRRSSISPLLKYISELEARLVPRAADEPERETPQGDEWDAPGYSSFFDDGLSARAR
jgi:hypothetical protein